MRHQTAPPTRQLTDALLVADGRRAQDVRDVLDALASLGEDDLL